MTAEMVRLAPAEIVKPRKGYIPYKRARRWQSPCERSLTPSYLEVFMTQSAFVQASEHAESDLNNEVGGWLLGKWRIDPSRKQQFIVVEKILSAPHTKYGSVYLTFTQDSQVAMYSVMEENYPGKEVLGWYHTHPGMGLFLSQYDTWLHKHFFPKPWQVALVIEPHTGTGGFFIPEPTGDLDPHCYCGFYEITNRSGGSVVHWNNMEALPALMAQM